MSKIIKCPNCGSIYHIGLYDYEYIHCNSGKKLFQPGCGTVFEKITGKFLAQSMEEYNPHPTTAC